MTTITTQTTAHIADLANIPVSSEETQKLAAGFTTTLGVVESLNAVDTTNVEPTNQVTGLENVFRDDVVDPSRMFSQEEATANAKRTHNGYIVVDQILAQ